jgi:predicted AlkP superfamily pyrophosphatase or phosphodiesterase
LSRTVLQGARSLPYTTLPEALVTLVRQLTTSPAPTYHMLYFDRLDGICHHHGPDTPYTDAETEAMLMILDRFLFRPLEGRAHRTLILITADHGQVEVNPKTTVYLNQDRRFAGWDKYLKKNRKGDRFLVPAGAPRDLFLYIHEDRMEEALAFFGDRLEGVAQVRKVRDMIEEEYFGPTPVSERFLARAGDLVILPYTGESVWWYEKDRFEQKFFGHHGGLTRQEMEIPLMFYAFE